MTESGGGFCEIRYYFGVDYYNVEDAIAGVYVVRRADIAMADPIFLQLIVLGREERNLEYKQTTEWNGEFRAQIAKSILAMSNIRDGGHIIIGMEKQSDDTYIAKGMEQSHLDSYTNDNVASFVSERADPYVRLTLTKQEDDSGQQYVWIRVEEFEEVPVICRKSFGQTLGGGKIYTRTRRFPESAEVPSSAEMREIIEMATEKRIRAFIQQASRAGIPLTTPTVPTAEEAFDKQLEGIFS